MIGLAAVWLSKYAGISFLILAGVFAIRAAWEWLPIRSRIPFDFQTPIVRRSVPVVKPLPPNRGRLDYELSYNNAADTMTRYLAKLTSEMERSRAVFEKQTLKVQRVVGKSVETRLRTLNRAAKAVRKHSRRLSGLEKGYGSAVSTLTEDGKKLIELMPPDEGIGDFLTTMREFRQVALVNRQSNEDYKSMAQTNLATQMSQDLNGAWTEVIAISDTFVSDADRVLEFCDWAIQWAIEHGAS